MRCSTKSIDRLSVGNLGSAEPKFNYLNDLKSNVINIYTSTTYGRCNFTQFGLVANFGLVHSPFAALCIWAGRWELPSANLYIST
jgi:hypothetical protein